MGPGVDLLVRYDPQWARLFEAERELLLRVLAPWLDGGIRHIGSTAVAGLAAKPIIDMIAGVRDLDEAKAAFEPLGAISMSIRRTARPWHIVSPSRERRARPTTSI